MSHPENLSARVSRILDRIEAKRATLSRPATGFTYNPDPRTIGSFARGRQLCAGNFLFSGHLLQEPETNIWDLNAPDREYSEALHGFGWLDDLAAAGDIPARTRAQDWLWTWIARFGPGRGPGWTPDLTGRRLIRWISHALFLLQTRDRNASDAFYKSLAQQSIFLSRRWKGAHSGLPRFEALTGLIYAGLSLEGMETHVEPALRALSHECKTQIDEEGGIPTRNPEELLEVFTLLTWAAMALSEAGKPTSDSHWAAIERIAPTLRTLRHSDGGLARFHGGGRGLEGRLDTALATSGVKGRNSSGLSMGYARISAGRTSLIIDAASPPKGAASSDAHASTLAFELTSGRRPLIVNCGSGASFGQDWRRAGRATPSHSTMMLDGRSSAQLGNKRKDLDLLTKTPTDVPVQMVKAPDGLRFEGGHNGYVPAYGLTHARTLDLTFDGRAVAGEDMLAALSRKDQKQFDTAMDLKRLEGIPFEIRFHLHPEVDASLDMAGSAVSMALKSGEIWVFRTDGRTKMSLQSSVYLERTRLKPRATKQIVLSGRTMEYATRIRWSLAKAQDTPISIRDLAQEEPEFAPVTENE